MRRYMFCLLLLATIGFIPYGCGTQGSSGMEENPSTSSSVMKGIALINSKQGQSGGFVDVDGDGIDDKVVGAPYAIKDSNIGVVLVYKGDSAGAYSSAPATLLTGDDNLGFSFVKLEKGTNDTSEGFAAGAISGSGDGDNDASLCGTVSIYRNGEPTIKISGEEAMDKFGYSLTSGDFNSDGYTDIAVGALFHTPSATLYQQGAVYVFFGPGFTDAGKVSLEASSTNKGLGYAMAAGDINNDTYTDLLISASGKVLVFKGVASGSNFEQSIDSPSLTISNSATGFGKAIAVVGDYDSDGKNEVAIGALNATVNSNRDTGSVYIIKGDATTTLAQMNGTNLFDRFGASLASVPDMDSDGKPELVVGATMVNADPDYLSGKVYLFKSSTFGSSWSPLSAFPGTAKDQSYGSFLAPAGGSKLLIGAPRSNMDTGGVSMVDLATGEIVAGGSSGGGGGDSGDCH